MFLVAYNLIVIEQKTNKKMYFKQILILIAISFSNLIHSQSYNYNTPNEFVIYGIISSLDDDELLEYATITLLDPKNSSVITGGISDSSGKF